MKKIFVFCTAVLLSACASVGPKNACSGEKFKIPSYFSQGERVAAFKVSGTAYGRGMDAILQIKKTDEAVYEATLFALAGGIRLMQAAVTPQGTEFTFLMKQADAAAVRSKAARLLKLLLFPPEGAFSCQRQGGGVQVRYKQEGGISYEYASGQVWPEAAVLSKMLGSARIIYGEYTPYETGVLPHLLVYQDGVLNAELILITLKK